MVQILPRPQQTFGERLEGGFSQGLQKGGNFAENILQNKLQERSKANLMRLQGEMEEKQKLANYEADKDNYEKIKKGFGKDFADIWMAAPTGGRTALLQAGLEAKARGVDLNQILGGNVSRETEDLVNDSRRQEKIDYTKAPEGFTPKEWAAERKEWGKTNRTTLGDSKEKIRANKRDVLGTKKIQKLNESGKLPEGLGRLILNPNTGEVYGVAQLAGKASPETQEFVKEIARFGNRAKDAFGSRVTNFDLFQYMKQFPGLLNTPEGRKRILKMMEINYELDGLYDQAIQKILDKYGSANIPPEEADRLAREQISEKEEKLFNDYLSLEKDNEREFLGEDLSGKMIDVIGPDGQIYEVDESEIELLPQGFRIQ